MLESQRDTLLKNSGDAMDVMEADLRNLLSKFGAFREKQSADFSAIDASLASVKTRIDQSETALVANKGLLLGGIDSIASTATKADAVTRSLVNEFDSLVSRNIQTNVDLLRKIDENATQQRNDLLDQLAATETKIQKRIADLQTIESDLCENIQSSISRRQADLEATNSAVTNNFAGLRTAMNTAINDANEANENIVQSIAITKIHFKGTQKKMLAEVAARVVDTDNLVKNQFIKDVPTGQTPQKTAYPYPTELAQTSPHERILERYRAAAANDVSFETLTEIDDVSEHRNESSLRDSDISSNASENNVENQIPEMGKIKRNNSKSALLKKQTSNDNLSKIPISEVPTAKHALQTLHERQPNY